MLVVMALVTTPLTVSLYPDWYQIKVACRRRGEIDWNDNSVQQEVRSDSIAVVKDELTTCDEVAARDQALWDPVVNTFRAFGEWHDVSLMAGVSVLPEYTYADTVVNIAHQAYGGPASPSMDQRSPSGLNIQGSTWPRPLIGNRSHHIVFPFFASEDHRFALEVVFQLALNDHVTVTVIQAMGSQPD
ncbi:hypothetical protein N7451_003057 [Penicillium sp. IBT 35674x]|nr:hypothetical protein N7451_003057 [Penicillium sp. IBT 35674x]